MASVFSNALVFRNKNGKAIRMIGSMQDMSKQKMLEEMLEKEFSSKEEYKESVRKVFDSSSDVLFDIDVETNKITFSSGYEKKFGYKITDKMTPEKDWAIHIHPDDREKVLGGYLRRKTSDDTQWSYSYRFLRADDSVATILSTGIIVRNADGKISRLIGVMHDISKQTLLEEKLEQEIKLKEKQIEDAVEDAKEFERAEIGKELHDNINQLLAASKLFIDLAKHGGESSETYLTKSSQYTMEAIEEIRKLTKGLTTDTIKNLGLCVAIENIATLIMEVKPVKIICALESSIEHRVNDKFKLNVFRIVQEQLNNILKHARATKVTISLSQNKRSINLGISDNGIGFDISKKREGIGVVNIKSRAKTYNGKANFISQPGQGCKLQANFPVSSVLLSKS